jgi:hypothetical protein
MSQKPTGKRSVFRRIAGSSLLPLLAATVGAVLAACMTPATPGARQGDPKGAGTRIEMGVGHFNRDGKAFHYWDKQKEIPAVCARCHSASGVPEYLKQGKNAPAPHVKNAFACTNCHADMLTYARHTVASVTFPSGATLTSGDNDANLCMTCHQGRESTASVNKAIAGKAPDTPDPKLGFVHVHYYPAGATLYGTAAGVGYQYAGKAYAGRFEHAPGMGGCTACHEAHSGEVRVEKCGACHQGGRPESAARRIADQKRELYAAIQRYARAVGGAAIAFTPDAHPYWYTDVNGNGKVDPEEFRSDNGYKAYTPRLLQAVYNYSYALRDPGTAYHNPRYAGQLLHDSLESLAASGKADVNMGGRTRP